MYVGFSDQHSSTIGRVLNLNTGSVTPQYHLVHDEQFSTVHGHLTDEVFQQQEWEDLIQLDSPRNNVEPEDIVGDRVPHEPLYDCFLEESSSTSDSTPLSNDSVPEGVSPSDALVPDVINRESVALEDYILLL